ncbi:MAG: hypothetical protein QM658_01930 [Gordonia sp. (in: high G+C Gram-positive bacteria)]
MDDAIEAAVLAALLAAAMTIIIDEYGWAWVMQNQDKVPDLLIGELPGWLADQVGKVKDWVAQFFADNSPDTPDADRTHDRVDALPKGSAKRPKVDIREVPDDAAAERLFEDLTRGGQRVDPGSYGGEVVEMPDGTRISTRFEPGKGRTIDIKYPDGSLQKIHTPKG